MSDFPPGFLEDLEKVLSAYLATDALVDVIEEAIWAATNASLNRETRASVLAAAESAAAERISLMTQAQKDRVAEIVRQALEAQIGPDGAARWIREGMGLDAQRQATLEKYRAELQAQGIEGQALEAKVARERQRLINERARVIASTEIGNALEAGALVDATERGATHKVWITVSANVCDTCLGNQDEGAIPIGQAFSGGVGQPLQHPRCLCSTSYVTDRGSGQLDRQNKLAKERSDKVREWREQQEQQEQQGNQPTEEE